MATRFNVQRRASLAFAVAWMFLFVVACLGVLMRFSGVWSIAWMDYANFLHAHSHLGFLGWVFNAFVALAIRHFAVDDDAVLLWRLFFLFQLANLGMLASFPLQGYGPFSIAFSALHMAGAGVFAWRLWRQNRAAPTAQGFLLVALIFMLLSGLGPLALGPLAALGHRESPWYSLAIYSYLHFQYNGWFVFFLAAVVLHLWHGETGADVRFAARGALPLLAVGCVATFAQSSLWLNPPRWVFAVALFGGVTQLIGALWLCLGLRGGDDRSWRRGGLMARILFAVAVSAWLSKNLLQTAAAWPDWIPLVNHRYALIGFLHLVFLGGVTPMLISLAMAAGWLRGTMNVHLGAWLFLAGAVGTGVVLAYVPLAGVFAWPSPPGTAAWLLAASVALAVGIGFIATGLDADRGCEAKIQSE